MVGSFLILYGWGLNPRGFGVEKNSTVYCFLAKARRRVPNAKHWVVKRIVCEADGKSRHSHQKIDL